MSYATVDELARALRVTVTAENTEGLQACLDAAATEIDHDLDRPMRLISPASAWLFSVSTEASDPGPGALRMDMVPPPPSGFLYVDDIDADGIERATDIASGQTGDRIRMSETADPNRWEGFELTDVPTDNVGWFSLPVIATGASAEGIEFAEGLELELAVLRPLPLLVEHAALANRVNIVRGVEWAKANDAAFGLIGNELTGALQAPRDGFNRHAYTLTPLKRQWGIA